MKEDGVHENFWTVPEMPWKRKEREMDNEFKKLTMRLLLAILLVLVSVVDHDPLTKDDRSEILSLMKDVQDYAGRLG